VSFLLDSLWQSVRLIVQSPRHRPRSGAGTGVPMRRTSATLVAALRCVCLTGAAVFRCLGWVVTEVPA